MESMLVDVAGGRQLALLEGGAVSNGADQDRLPLHVYTVSTGGMGNGSLWREVRRTCVCCAGKGRGRRGCGICRDERWREVFCACFRRGLRTRQWQGSCCRCFLAGWRLRQEAPGAKRLVLGQITREKGVSATRAS